jgi:hypothetical protein
VSPIFGQLETSLADYLTAITYRAQFGDERAAAIVARYELPRVVEALKAVLDEHSPDENGRCPSCRTSRFGRAPAPCRAYLTAHLCLVVTEEEQPAEATAPMRKPIVLPEPAPLRGYLKAPG